MNFKFISCIVGLIFSVIARSSFAEPYRIVSLNPSLTEILFALDLGTNIVGTVKFSDFPADALKIPSVGDYTNPNFEKIVALKPTHVVVLKEGHDTISPRMNKTKISFLSYSSKNLGDYTPLLLQLGDKFNKQEKANTLAKEWEKNWQQIVPSKVTKKILLQLDHEPIIIAANNTFLSEIIKKCGHNNIFEHLSGYPKISPEAIVGHIPDLIVVLGPPINGKVNTAIKNYWAKQALTKNVPILTYDPSVLSKVVPRLPLETKMFCNQVNQALQVKTP